MVRLITESDLRACIDVDADSIAAVEAGFCALARDEVTQPPILRVDVPAHHGELDVKTAYVEGLDSFAVKMSSGFFDNPSRGLPTGSGLMVLFSATTGAPVALLLDNGYLTDVRTAAAGAIAAKHLAVERPKTVGIVGAGNQARHQLRALREVRPFERVAIYARDRRRASRFADEVRAAYRLEAEVGSLDEVFEKSDIVVTTTPAKSPLVTARHVHAGLHVTAMGSDAEDKCEVAADALERADRLVVDSTAQSVRLGELRAAPHLVDRAVELGKITSGAAAGRRREDEVTICDLTGTGVQDTMIARMAYRRAVERGLGVEIER